MRYLRRGRPQGAAPTRRSRSTRGSAPALLALLLAGCTEIGRAPLLPFPFMGLRDEAASVSSFQAWPLVDTASSAGASATAVHPLFYTLREGETHRFTDALYPIFLYRRTDRGTRTYIWPLYSKNTYTDPEEGKDVDSYLNPLFFWGSDENGERYFSFFPIAGKFKGGMFGNDRTTFYLFPLYIHREVLEARSTSILWPFSTFYSSPEKHAWRIWPLAAHQRTDGGADKESSWGTSVIWPIFTRSGRRSPNGKTEDNFSLFPLFRYSWGTEGTGISFVWPIFDWSTSTRTNRDGTQEVVKLKRQLIPIYYHHKQEAMDTYSYLWPISTFTWIREVREPGKEAPADPTWRTNFYVLPAYWEFWGRPPGGRPTHTLKIWPLYQKLERKDGSLDVEVPSLPLYPAPQWRWRNHFQVFWRLFTVEEAEGRRSVRLLGNLYLLEERGDRWSARLFPFWAGGGTPDSSESAWLAGLFRVRTAGGARRVSLFYLPWF